MLRQVMYFAQSYVADKWQSQDSITRSPASKPWPFSVTGGFPRAGGGRLGYSPSPATKSYCDLGGSLRPRLRTTELDNLHRPFHH